MQVISQVSSHPVSYLFEKVDRVEKYIKAIIYFLHYKSNV